MISFESVLNAPWTLRNVAEKAMEVRSARDESLGFGIAPLRSRTCECEAVFRRACVFVFVIFPATSGSSRRSSYGEYTSHFSELLPASLGDVVDIGSHVRTFTRFSCASSPNEL